MGKRSRGGNGYSGFELEVSGRLGTIEARAADGDRRFTGVEKGIGLLTAKVDDVIKSLDKHTDDENKIWSEFAHSLNEVREKVENPKVSVKPLFRGFVTQFVLPAAVVVLSAVALNWWLHLFGP